MFTGKAASKTLRLLAVILKDSTSTAKRSFRSRYGSW